MNSLGHSLRVSLQGESHGPALVVVVDGLPAGLPVRKEDFSADLARRRPQGDYATARQEPDVLHLLTGVHRGYTTGAPVTVSIENRENNSSDYQEIEDFPRPGHADFVAYQKFGEYCDLRGGGVFSGRTTVGIVAAGTLAGMMLRGVQVEAKVESIGGRTDWAEYLREVAAEGDSLGGIVTCETTGVPAGWGDPYFDSVESLLAHGLFAIPGVKGVEFGDGFAAATLRGSEYNDAIVDASGQTATNHCGGVNGGISNGNQLRFRVVARPPASIRREQQSYSRRTGRVEPLRVQGRHDSCFVTRLPVVVEGMTKLVLGDLALRRMAELGARKLFNEG